MKAMSSVGQLPPGIKHQQRCAKFHALKKMKIESRDTVSLQIRNFGEIRVPWIDPSRQVSMSAARASL